MALPGLSHARPIKCTPDMPVAPPLAGMAARAAMRLPVLMTISLDCAGPATLARQDLPGPAWYVQRNIIDRTRSMAPENMLWLISSIFLAVISFLKAMQGPQKIGAFAVGSAMAAQALAIVTGHDSLAMWFGALGVGLVFLLFVAELLWRRRHGKDLE
jgi:hypothetical protein